MDYDNKCKVKECYFMKDDQIIIKFVNRNRRGKHPYFIYPKPYTFLLTPRDKKEFGDDLEYARRGLIEVPKLGVSEEHKGETVIVPFAVQEVGHFDDEVHKPLKIVKMFKKQYDKSEKNKEDHDDLPKRE